jgi:cell division protein FtsI (penicillin-binding protein 3)
MRRLQKWRISKKMEALSDSLAAFLGKTEWFYQNELRKARANNNRYYLISRIKLYRLYKIKEFPFKLGLTKEESL